MQNATRVAMEGDLPLWTQSKLHQIGLDLWVDRKAPSFALPEVLVATSKARDSPSRLFKRCRDNGIPMCTEDWLHECERAVSKGKAHPSYRTGRWCFNSWHATEEDLSEQDMSDEDMEDVHEVGGIEISYRSYPFTTDKRTWEAIGFTHSGTIIAVNADNKQVWWVAMLDHTGCGTISAMKKRNFPIISPAHPRDLPDRMDMIYAIAISRDERWLLCVWKDGSDSFDTKNGCPFKLVSQAEAQDKYKSLEVALWFNALRSKATHRPSSKFKGGSVAFRAVIERIC